MFAQADLGSELQPVLSILSEHIKVRGGFFYLQNTKHDFFYQLIFSDFYILI